jgi:hypothetical protein
MNVLAFSTRAGVEWRWRIVGYSGETVEESQATFATIAQAVAAGSERLQQNTDRDRPRPAWPGRR